MENIKIPKQLIEDYQKFNLNENEVIILIKMFKYEKRYINLIVFLETEKIKKQNIQNLLDKEIISLKNQENNVYIDLDTCSNKLSNQNKNNNILNEKDISRINFILNRELKQYEIDKILFWIEAGYQFKEIEEAIYKSLIKNIDNFSYIEAILFNKADDKNNKVEKKLKRTWNFE